jgi:hypothetical protein
MTQRWAIYIDIEGFSELYDREDLVLRALGDLMEGIYLIGEKCYPESPNRLFAHQSGDGFVIVSEFGASSLEDPVAVSIALLRHVAGRGRFAKASIGEGEFADIIGCYPKRIRDAYEGGGTIPLKSGGGLMTLFPVMGTALIDAVGIAKRSPSGSLLTLSARNQHRLPTECIKRKVDDQDIVSVDWVHSDLPLVTSLQQKAGLRNPPPSLIKHFFSLYARKQRPPKPWIDGTVAYLDLAD